MEKWIYVTDSIENSVEELAHMPEGTFGFIYKITNTVNGKFYIGKKQIFSTKKRNFKKKELEQILDKRKSKFEYVTKESNWLKYTGSNKELNDDIKNGYTIKKEILHYCFNKSELTYYETKYQFTNNVLEIDSYNDNILGKFYKTRIFQNKLKS